MAEDKKSQTQVVAELLNLIEASLKTEKKTKGTLLDYIRLVQLQKEIEEEDPRDIKVGWVDKLETDKLENDKLETEKLVEDNQPENGQHEDTGPKQDSGPSNS